MFSVRKTWKSAFLAVFIWKLQSSWLVALPGTSHWRWYNFPESRDTQIYPNWIWSYIPLYTYIIYIYTNILITYIYILCAFFSGLFRT
jgi:hypothetical protein